MIESYLFSMFLNVFGTIFIFWLVINTMIKKKKIVRYLPFYFLAFMLFLSIIFNYLNTHNNYLWGSLEVVNGVCLLIIYIILEKSKWN